MTNYLTFVLYYVSYFPRICDKNAQQKSLKGEGLILAHGSRAMVAEA